MIKKLDFDALAKSIVDAGAGKIYEIAPWSGEVYTPHFDGDETHYPQYPGDKAYFHGPYILGDEGDLPQKLVDANNKSFRDAISIYMQPDNIAAHLCDFFRGDFQSSSVYQDIVAQNLGYLPNLEKSKRREDSPYYGEKAVYPPESLSFAFDNSVRKSRCRGYYTLAEIETAEKICNLRPNIYNSFAAFQAGLTDYLRNLRLSLAFNKNLEGKQRVRVLDAIDELSQGLGTPNFISEMLPAICLAYYVRDPEMDSDLTAEDFKSGFQIALKVGLFTSFYRARNDNSERKFTCPAASMIGSVMGRNEQSLNRIHEPASMLAMIYTILQSKGALERNVEAAPEIKCG